MSKKIALIGEGGAGDFALTARFVPAIRKEYGKDCFIRLYMITDGATFQKEMLEALFPDLIDEYVILGAGAKISKEYPLKNNCYNVVENFPAYFGNLIPYIREEILKHDVAINGHPDWMQWAQNPRFRAAISTNLESDLVTKKYDKEFVVFNPYSQVGGKNYTEDFHLRKMVDFVISLGYDAKIIVNDHNKVLLPEDLAGKEGVEIINLPVKGVCEVIADENCKLFCGLDSGWKYVARSLLKPIIVFSCYSPQPHCVNPAQMLRWMSGMEKNCFPLNFDLGYMLPIIKKVLERPEADLFPHPEFEKLANLKYIGNIYNHSNES